MQEKKLNKSSRSKSYFIYLIIVLMCVEILDTYTTNFPNVIPSRIIAEFLSNYPINIANSIFALCIAIASLGTYIVFFSQLMADRFGRKILLGLTVFGMGFSSLLIALSTDIVTYTLSLFALYLFFSSDIWIIYINEESPPEKRAFWTNIVLIGGVTGSILLPVFRSIFISETVSNWRGMTLFAIIWGIPLSLVIFLSLKESTKYEEIKEEKANKEIKIDTNILKSNLKTIFTSVHKKEFFAILIISLIVGMNYIFASLGESFISSSPNLNQNDINIVVLVMSISVVFGYLITGIVADKYGRKPLFYIYSILIPTSITLIILGSNLTEGAIFLVCIGAGLVNITYWGLGVVIRITTLEILPTNARGTGSGLKSLIQAVGITFGLLLSSLITFFFGLATSFVIISMLLLINLPLVYFFLKETKGVNLSEVK